MSPTILIADDQDDLRSVMRRLLLRHQPFVVLEASDGPQAIELWRSNPIDLAILDHRMPGMSGTEVARTLRTERFLGPIVLFSAFLDPEVETEAAALDLVTLAKSEIRELARLVASALTGPRR